MPTNGSAEFASVLVSASRSATMDPAWDIYAPLLGNWHLTMIDYDASGRTIHKLAGLWYFSRTLEGRAIQDVLVSPGFSERSQTERLTGNRYGSTFRMMDPKSGQWQIDWFNPVTGIHNQLTAHVEGSRIVQETPKSNGVRMRWVFENITDQSFHWYGEDSADDGQTWILSTEFFAKREVIEEGIKSEAAFL